MNKELRTMAEKQAQDPNELMENGFTRQQNEERQKSDATAQGVVSLIVTAISIYCLISAFSNLSALSDL
jgi:hypothetical protein